MFSQLDERSVLSDYVMSLSTSENRGSPLTDYEHDCFPFSATAGRPTAVRRVTRVSIGPLLRQTVHASRAASGRTQKCPAFVRVITVYMLLVCFYLVFT